MRAVAARQFSQAADLLVDACRKLESCGIDDPPIDRLLRALDDVTSQVHQMHPPEERLQPFEPADQAVPPCRIAGLDDGSKACHNTSGH